MVTTEELEEIGDVTKVRATNGGRSVTVNMDLDLDMDGAYEQVEVEDLSEVVRKLSAAGFTVSIPYIDPAVEMENARAAVTADK